ncbi:hypothetical protein BJ138DRAFT_111713 [Hygrophoropsis aurantiaca]|uniref:Uncharacterized protein n=1 Tax=Hygrophoropsis aurantiaca TaxID=72124 RepID=A0ACB8ABE0_9AGAM|nr:hypothetical protein BJ138DRAFT_111713 [Hygrophoropsis aurantiaca]
MSSVSSALELVDINNYFSIVTVLLYDYLLSLSKEVELVWRRSFSTMSFLYFIVRYFGLTIAITAALWGNAIHGSIPVSTILLQFIEWGSYVFIWASEVVMIIRVYAMYSHSKVILGLLLASFMATIVASIFLGIAYYSPSTLLVTEADLAGTYYCVQSGPSIGSFPYIHLTIPRAFLDVLLLVLSIAQLVKTAVETHKMLGQWRLNVYLRMLVRDSVLYYFLNLLYIAFAMAEPFAVNLPISVQLTGIAFSNIAPFMLTPKLIISFRHYCATSETVMVGDGGRVQLTTTDGNCEMCFVGPEIAATDGVTEESHVDTA